MPMTVQDKLLGIFEVLVLVTGSLIPIALLAYALLPEDNPSAQRIAWITLGIVVSLAVIGAVVSRLAKTETIAEVSSSIGFLCTVVVIIVSEIVLAKCLPYEFWSFVWGISICIFLLICDIDAWAECAGRPKVHVSKNHPRPVQECLAENGVPDLSSATVLLCEQW